MDNILIDVDTSDLLDAQGQLSGIKIMSLFNRITAYLRYIHDKLTNIDRIAQDLHENNSITNSVKGTLETIRFNITTLEHNVAAMQHAFATFTEFKGETHNKLEEINKKLHEHSTTDHDLSNDLHTNRDHVKDVCAKIDRISSSLSNRLHSLSASCDTLQQTVNILEQMNIENVDNIRHLNTLVKGVGFIGTTLVGIAVFVLSNYDSILSFFRSIVSAQ